MRPLQQLAIASDAFADQHTVAYSDAGPVSWQQLQQRCRCWVATFKEQPARRIALYHNDTLEFAAALLAMWRLGKVPVLPALGRVDEALTQVCSTFAGQFLGGDNLLPGQSVPGNEMGEPAERVLPQDTDIALSVFTSGSSGTPVAIEKTFRQLNNELSSWESMRGDLVSNAVFTGTVSHQHIYGLLFRLLWPLCAGHPWVNKFRDFWEDIFFDSQRYDQLVLITSPAHLDRMPTLEIAHEEWQQLSKACCWVVSSGAPLALDSAVAAQQRLHQEVTEVYGSSETGGVAWRQQCVQPDWQCLPEVKVRQQDGLLYIRSPHLADDQWFATADRCEVHDEQHFQLLGRSDRLVKLGGKRVSLTAIEQQLASHPLVQQCRVISLPEKQDRLGAVVCLTNEGNRQLVDTDRSTLNQQLRQFLEQGGAQAHVIERIALPRYWRYLSDLPRNNQGKVTQLSLQGLFAAEQVNFAEIVEQVQIDEQCLEMQLFIPMNLFYFQGHFPGTPILPGVVQTHWAIHYAREYFDLKHQFSHLEAIKFQQVIRPHDVVTLRLEYKADKEKLVFSYTSPGAGQLRKHSSGRVVFSAVGAASE